MPVTVYKIVVSSTQCPTAVGSQAKFNGLQPKMAVRTRDKPPPIVIHPTINEQIVNRRIGKMRR